MVESSVLTILTNLDVNILNGSQRSTVYMPLTFVVAYKINYKVYSAVKCIKYCINSFVEINVQSRIMITLRNCLCLIISCANSSKYYNHITVVTIAVSLQTAAVWCA